MNATSAPGLDDRSPNALRTNPAPGVGRAEAGTVR